MTEHVEHPAHYNSLGAKCGGCGRPIECIDVVGAMSFNLGNAVKYVWRAPHKGRSIEDLKKARFYLDFEIKKREAEAAANRVVDQIDESLP